VTRASLGFANVTYANLDGADLTDAQLGPDPVVPPGWIVTYPKTGELRRRPAEPARPDGQHDTAGPRIADDN
jgi:hypothetical protein